MIKLKAKALKILKNQSQVLPFDQVTTPKQIKKKEGNSKISRIKECVKEATLSSTIHGIPNALRAEKTCIKFMWIIGFSITVSTSIYLISKNINASELALHRKIKPKYPNGTNITLEDLRASVVAFSVYYSDFKYTFIQQLPKMQIVDAVSNFGGLLGLFVGVSFLSFIELIECLIQIVLISLEKD